MSVIHEQLYRETDLSNIDAKAYVEEIIRELLYTYNANARIKTQLNLKQVHFDIDQSVPFGLILNEVLVNSIKHGIPDGEGTIKIELNEMNDHCHLMVTDSGKGFDTSKVKDTMGLDLIDTLTQQLEGNLNIQSDNNGTRVHVSFPKNQ